MSMYNLVKYGDTYSKVSASLWQYFKDEPVLDNIGGLINFCANNAMIFFKFKEKKTSKTRSNGTNNVYIMLPLKNLSNSWRTWKYNKNN